MCWCNPNLRTPCCGAPDCHPPEDRALQGLIESLAHLYGSFRRLGLGPPVSIVVEEAAFWRLATHPLLRAKTSVPHDPGDGPEGPWIDMLGVRIVPGRRP
jgi:hypothetical protein